MFSSVTLQCTRTEGKADAFVRDVKAASEQQCVLFACMHCKKWVVKFSGF